MAGRPSLLIVHDNPDVRGVIAEDLRVRYGDQHDVRSTRSGADALELLRDAQSRGDSVALVLADQRMPRQSGQ
ncbi:MAG TPA: fused response regulator/thioredoxin-disulfide reductase, partial [Chloroflexota bacterium]|nr:fused response regulator/thioredoxin-disulfide reductase [Chloroflexota bacterium]